MTIINRTNPILAVLTGFFLLFVCDCCLFAENLLKDSGFGLSNPNGSFPDSGWWYQMPASTLAGAVCDDKGRSESNGLHQYTAEDINNYFFGTYQDVQAEPGNIYFVSAWVKNAIDQPSWVEGSKASVRLRFLDSGENTLAEYESRPLIGAGSNWTLLFFATKPAPALTESARFILYLEKPQVEGQSLVKFDDCCLRKIECTDCIGFTSIPECGCTDDLTGWVSGVDPQLYDVIVYVFLDDWWPKPAFENPWTSVDSNGMWQCDIHTAETDVNTTEIMAFLVPKSERQFWPADMNQIDGLPSLPGEFFKFPSVGAFRPACHNIVDFSGVRWKIKESLSRQVGPGPNFFSSDNVTVDANGMHLKISNKAGQWLCAEAFTADSNISGNGSYEVTLQADINALDPCAVAGFFTWDEFAPHYTNREIDLEIGRWGNPYNDNAQFVLQPWGKSGHLHRFDVEQDGNITMTYQLYRQDDCLYFRCFNGDANSASDANLLMDSWYYNGDDIPLQGTENFRLNFWLDNGNAPSNGQEAEILIKSFRFVPLSGFRISPSPLDFGQVLTDETVSKYFTITNTGEDGITVESVRLDGPDANAFLLPDLAFELDPNCSKDIQVSFSPDEVRAYTAFLDITMNGTVERVELVGSGTKVMLLYVPVKTRSKVLRGRTSVDPSQYYVVVYIYTDKWYIKPPWQPRNSTYTSLRKIRQNGSWRCPIEISTTPTDKLATKVAVLLWPKDNPSWPYQSFETLPEDAYEFDLMDLQIRRIIAVPGRLNSGDKLLIRGEYHIDWEQIKDANSVRILVWQDDKLISELNAPFDPNAFRRNGYNYKNNFNEQFIHLRLNRKHVRIESTYLGRESYSGSLLISLKNTDLSWLRNPITLQMIIGDFNDSGVADENMNDMIINGRRTIPIHFLSGCTNALRIDKAVINSTGDSLGVKGGIATSPGCWGIDIVGSNIRLVWGQQTFTIPAYSFVEDSKLLRFRCRNGALLEGGSFNGVIDLSNCSFLFNIKGVAINTDADYPFFAVLVDDYNQSVLLPENFR